MNTSMRMRRRNNWIQPLIGGVTLNCSRFRMIEGFSALRSQNLLERFELFFLCERVIRRIVETGLVPVLTKRLSIVGRGQPRQGDDAGSPCPRSLPLSSSKDMPGFLRDLA